MRLVDGLQAVLILDEIEQTGRDEAVAAILEHLAAKALVPPALVSELATSIALRDELGPTGIGEGIAIPHASHPGLDRMVAALAVSHPGLDYPSLDNRPVHIVLLVLSPVQAAVVSAKGRFFDTWLRHLRDPALRASLRLAATPDELWRAVRAGDAASGGTDAEWPSL